MWSLFCPSAKEELPMNNEKKRKRRIASDKTIEVCVGYSLFSFGDAVSTVHTMTKKGEKNPLTPKRIE